MNNSQTPTHINDRNLQDRQDASGNKHQMSGEKGSKPQDRSMTYSNNQSRFEQATNSVKLDRPTDFTNQERFDEEPSRVRHLEEQITSLKSIIEEKEMLIQQLNQQNAEKHEQY